MAARPARRLLHRSEIICLSVLGEATSALTKAERRRARQDAVQYAQARRLDGVSWPLLAEAIGVSPRTLRRWRREVHDTKRLTAGLVLALGRAESGLVYEVREVPQPGLQSISAHSSQNESIAASIVSVGTLSSPPDAPGLRIMLPVEPSRPKRGVLFLGGHPQGGFRFDQEAADVRRLVWPTSVPFDYASCVALAEVTYLIDEHGPRLLHVSAHAVFGGCWLSHEDSPTAVLWSAFHEAITRAKVRPVLAVFNACDSADLAALTSDGVAFVVTCARQVDDDAARLFAGEFFRGLVRLSVRDSFEGACATLQNRHPETDKMYELHARSGQDQDTVLFG